MPNENYKSCALVSLIVPVYNAERYIGVFYDQFKAQTYPNIELVFVNDGSKDGSSAILRRLAEADDRVRVYEKENGGPASARNIGKAKANGEYLVFADVDDTILPTYVEYLYKLISETGADLSVCATVKVGEDEDWHKFIAQDKNEIHVLNNEEAIHAFAYRKLINGYPVIKMYRTCIANESQFPEDIVYGEDYIYVYNVLKHCKRVTCGTSIQYIYIQFKLSSTHIKRDNTQRYWRAWRGTLEVLNDAKKAYPGCYAGIVGKCYLLAINNVTRLYDKRRDKEFLQELYDFIRTNAKSVFRDREERKSTRVLGLLGMVSPALVSTLCDWVFKLCDAFSLTLRHTM